MVRKYIQIAETHKQEESVAFEELDKAKLTVCSSGRMTNSPACHFHCSE